MNDEEIEYALQNDFWAGKEGEERFIFVKGRRAVVWHHAEHPLDLTGLRDNAFGIYKTSAPLDRNTVWECVGSTVGAPLQIVIRAWLLMELPAEQVPGLFEKRKAH